MALLVNQIDKSSIFQKAKQTLENDLNQLLTLATKSSEIAALVQPTVTRAEKRVNYHYDDFEDSKIDKAIQKIQASSQEIKNHQKTIRNIHHVITERDFTTGLSGVPVGVCYTSDVDPIHGVSYAGIPIAQLHDKSVEEIFFLLDKRRLPEQEELQNYKNRLKEVASTPPVSLANYYCDNPMDSLEATLQSFGKHMTKNYKEDALYLRGHLPFIVASVINHYAGWGPSLFSTPDYDPDLDYVENFVHMLQMPNKDEKSLVKILRLFLILHADHGGGNLSTEVAKNVASGKALLSHALAAGMIALSTPLHGGANQVAFEFVQEAVGKDPDAMLIERLEKGRLIPGCGHRILRATDARATILADFCKEHFPDHPLVQTALNLYAAAPRILLAKTNTRNPYPNVDAFSGTALYVSGFPYPEYFTVLFGFARMAGGILSQICDERGQNLPLHRPDYIYRGPEVEKED